MPKNSHIVDFLDTLLNAVLLTIFFDGSFAVVKCVVVIDNAIPTGRQFGIQQLDGITRAFVRVTIEPQDRQPVDANMNLLEGDRKPGEGD